MAKWSLLFVFVSIGYIGGYAARAEAQAVARFTVFDEECLRTNILAELQKQAEPLKSEWPVALTPGTGSSNPGMGSAVISPTTVTLLGVQLTGAHHPFGRGCPRGFRVAGTTSSSTRCAATAKSLDDFDDDVKIYLLDMARADRLPATKSCRRTVDFERFANFYEKDVRELLRSMCEAYQLGDCSKIPPAEAK